MTTVVAAILTPVLGGIVSYIIWQSKKNSETVSKGLNNLHDCVHEVSRKVDDVQLDIAKNYCTRDELKEHIDREEDWHDQHHTEVKELRQEFNEKTEKLTHDVAEMKEMQWMMRLDQLNKDKKN